MHQRRVVSLIILILVGVSLISLWWLDRVGYPSRDPIAWLTAAHAESNEATRIAVIGDFGMDNQAEADVARLVTNWLPDVVVTTGDNNYPDGKADTIDDNIGKYFSAYIHPYRGAYGTGSSVNRFFPTLGNHDWRTTAGEPPLPYAYLDYFELPGNERYYDVEVGPVHLFALDSDRKEPDGIDVASPQAAWLRSQLAGSTAPWRIVVMHHPPYSSSTFHGSTPALQWPYAAWGATAVLAGHDHTYERLVCDGIVYIVNGIGGSEFYPFGPPIAGSEFRFNQDYGALLIEATTEVITYTLATRTGAIYDTYVQYAVDFPPPGTNGSGGTVAPLPAQTIVPPANVYLPLVTRVRVQPTPTTPCG